MNSRWQKIHPNQTKQEVRQALPRVLVSLAKPPQAEVAPYLILGPLSPTLQPDDVCEGERDAAGQPHGTGEYEAGRKHGTFEFLESGSRPRSLAGSRLSRFARAACHLSPRARVFKRRLVL